MATEWPAPRRDAHSFRHAIPVQDTSKWKGRRRANMDDMTLPPSLTIGKMYEINQWRWVRQPL